VTLTVSYQVGFIQPKILSRGSGRTRREYVSLIEARLITMGVQPILIDKLDIIVVARPTIIVHIVRVRLSRN
jgi:hypothetical protein